MMRPLEQQIKEAQDIRDRCEKDPSLGSVMYWVGRLSALKEAEVIYEAHISDEYAWKPWLIEQGDRIRKPRPSSVNIAKLVEEEFKKCKESSEYFMEIYGAVKTENGAPHLNSNEVLVVDAEFFLSNDVPWVRFLKDGEECGFAISAEQIGWIALPTTPEALQQSAQQFEIHERRRGNGYFILDELGEARKRILAQNGAKIEAEVNKDRQTIMVDGKMVIYLRN